ncbi:hypothetical protein ASPZODRAFT_1120079 [Penicilliopsis zonata CBS 506.65]|uniref:Uncharacterized protein n=1 Tax=Penicilliopsis zonata CBS 506.65 TaxID=1073090 RepID=A0A1L9SSH3_9EURO|nr:hypothetical protein ASPZODRAFT_1120079 [Penicilliopsis zonata CBS 506.65]OJJ50162.1 hypothetical protein ASPZODRAFT_1120079 [Penicilliopsis zonata CBS 506.65]
MSLDPSAFPRSNSPASSECSLSRPRLRGKEDALRKDKSYRRYASSVERALSLFDNALQEWADYISFLSRLMKALQSHPPDLPIVPHKVLVSKRLAQCMNASLPSGVHQKALETYTYIFDLIKSDGLAQDLSLYLPGIAPTLTFASLSVRPLFISLIETYVPNLDPLAIRPALKSIILALLPGLEEETSDDFEATLRLFNKFRHVSAKMGGHSGDPDAGADGQYFWQCLFLASITNPSRRLGVLAYLNRFLPKLGVADFQALGDGQAQKDTPDDMAVAAKSVISPEPGLLVRCFASGLRDGQLLVQRNFLDLLVTHLPLDSPILQSRITGDDLQTLVLAAVGVVTRRDMSLNRRLWGWLLGPEPANDGNESAFFGSPKPTSDNARPSTSNGQELSQSQYFIQFGLKPLANGLLDMVKQRSTVPSERTKPFRISLSLMDRWEVGGSIVPMIFLPVLESVQAFEREASSKSHFDEAFRSASAFFDGVESGVIFSELLGLVDWKLTDLQNNIDKVSHSLKLAQFILDNFNFREEDMLLIHVPLLVLSILVKMGESHTLKDENLLSNKRTVSQGLGKMMNSLFGLLSERAFLTKAFPKKMAVAATATDEPPTTGILGRIHDFYEQSKTSLDLPPLPFHPEQLVQLIIREVYGQAISALEDADETLLVHEKSSLLIAILKKLPKSNIFNDGRFYSAIHNRLANAPSNPSTASFSVLSSITSSVTSLYLVQAPGFYISHDYVSDLIPPLVQQLWQYLSPLSPKFHVEAVRCLWLLHSVSWPDHLVEASLASLMIDSSSTGPLHLSSEEQAEHFFVLWTHSQGGLYDHQPKQSVEPRDPQCSYHSSMLERPLFIVLDLIFQGASEASQEVQRWLQDLPSIHRVLEIVVLRFNELFLRAERQRSDKAGSLIAVEDFRECNYLLRTISNILSSLSHHGWNILLNHTPSHAERSPDTPASEDKTEIRSLHATVLQATVAVITSEVPQTVQRSPDHEKLQQAALFVLRQLLLGPGAEEISEYGIDTLLMNRLSHAIDDEISDTVQSAIIDTLTAALKVRFSHAYLPALPPRPKHHRAPSRDRLTSSSLLSLTSDKAEKAPALPGLPQPPPQLLDCFLKGLSSPKSREFIDKWIFFLCEILPIYSASIFQILLKLVECFCKEVQLSYTNLQSAFKETTSWPQDRAEHAIISLLAGLETCIATAHERLLVEEANIPAAKSPDQQHGFFGNMVSGVFTTDGNQSRSTAANNRLTVLLCFQDAVRLCFSIWSWGASERSPQDLECLASFQYTSLRMRNRSRRILEHFFNAEALECLETMVELWTKSDAGTSALILSLLHTLEGSRPKITKSAMTSSLSESELAGFLVTYAKSLDDDVLDEIWTDCTTFLRDVLSNPFPHRQILPRLVEFAAILGTKMENTNFGDDRRMRKELGDVLLRMLTAVFTSKPQDSGLLARPSLDSDGAVVSHVGPDDMLSILARSMPALITTLSESDRINTAVIGISTNVIVPIFRSRLFPNNINRNVIRLLQQIAKVPGAAKLWKKDVGDAFNDARFFSSQLDLVKSGWMGLLRQWVLVDKERLAELMSRLPPPSSAGIMFGVGASAARLEADRKTQLNLRRIALLVLSASPDYFVGELPALLQKLEDLLAATSLSSPSSATRAEIFMVLRSLALKSSPTALAPFWPLINDELQEAISAVPQGQQSELYNPCSLLQACKLLDTLLVSAPDDFQLIEWLFVTDTVDAVYRPDRWEPVALADEVSQSLGAHGVASPTMPSEAGTESSQGGLKRPWLISDSIRETAKDELVERVLRPFFDRLSIHAFESTYSMHRPDLGVCEDDLLADLFNESTMAN